MEDWSISLEMVDTLEVDIGETEGTLERTLEEAEEDEEREEEGGRGRERCEETGRETERFNVVGETPPLAAAACALIGGFEARIPIGRSSSLARICVFMPLAGNLTIGKGVRSHWRQMFLVSTAEAGGEEGLKTENGGGGEKESGEKRVKGVEEERKRLCNSDEHT